MHHHTKLELPPLSRRHNQKIEPPCCFPLEPLPMDRVLAESNSNIYYFYYVQIIKRPKTRKEQEEYLLAIERKRFMLFGFAIKFPKFSTSVELESDNVCLSVCLSVCLYVCLSENFGAGWRLQKSFDLAEILHTSSLGEYLGVFFSFFKILIFRAWIQIFALTKKLK